MSTLFIDKKVDSRDTFVKHQQLPKHDACWSKQEGKSLRKTGSHDKCALIHS